MNILFYQTGFDPSKNGIYENIDTYLSSLNPRKQILDYKYVEPALSTTIKIPVFQGAGDPNNIGASHMPTAIIGNYCKMIDEHSYYDGETYKTNAVYYYYVMGATWRGKQTLEVTLALDTLNTFKKEIDANISSESHITREFRDRYHVSNILGQELCSPVIDAVSEEFTAVPMVRKSIGTINPEITAKWNLVYMTEKPDSTDLSTNPVTCYAIPSSSIMVGTHMGGSVTVYPSYFQENIPYLMEQGMNNGDSLTYKTGAGIESTITLGATSGTSTTAWVLMKHVGEALRIIIGAYNSSTQAYTVVTRDADTITFHVCKQIYRQPETFDYKDLSAAIYHSPYTIDAGEQITSLISFREWYENNKTDSRLIKIRELPYAPFEVTLDADDAMEIPTGWELSGKLLKFTGTTFGSYQLASRSFTIYGLSKGQITDTEHAISRETKLYNSAFYGDKLVYDTNTWVAAWENYNSGEIIGGDASLNIRFAVSDGMDNGMLFQVNEPFTYDTDFGEYMTIDKSTDKPYFTNEYLNYMRYGKHYDEKAAGWNIGSSAVSGLGSIATSVSSMAFAGAQIGGVSGGGAGAIVGTVVGMITAAVGLAKTASTAFDTVNSKLESYSHQASSVNGSSDVSLFNIYSGNKLLNIIYEPRSEIKSMLYNYFRLYGYATDAYRKPICSRRWVDFFKVEPVFTPNDSYDGIKDIWSDFLEDIKQRMAIGYRIYHYNDGYDFNFEKENWETSLWNWAH